MVVEREVVICISWRALWTGRGYWRQLWRRSLNGLPGNDHRPDAAYRRCCCCCCCGGVTECTGDSRLHDNAGEGWKTASTKIFCDWRTQQWLWQTDHLSWCVLPYCVWKNRSELNPDKCKKRMDAIITRSSVIAEKPRDASCQLKSCQLPGWRNNINLSVAVAVTAIRFTDWAKCSLSQQVLLFWLLNCLGSSYSTA